MDTIETVGRERREKRWTTEDCWILDVALLPLYIPVTSPLAGTIRASRISGTWRTIRVRYTLTVEETGTVFRLAHGAERTVLGDAQEERVELLTTEPNFGGTRWWFSCPLSKAGRPCNRRVAKLYLPPGGRHFGCRGCHELTYRSCRRSHRYDRICRIMSGGSPEAEEALKRTFKNKAREGRRRALEALPTLLERFDEAFG